MAADIGYLAPGTCTLVASVKATSTTEASEVSKSLTVSAYPLPGGQRPLLPREELSFEAPSNTYLGGVVRLDARAARSGLRVVSLTPVVCTVSPHEFEVKVMLLRTGTCTLTASLPKTVEHEALEVTRSILVGTATFTSTPPSAAVVGGSYEVSATSSAQLPVYLGAQGACSLGKPDLEMHLPEEERGSSAPPGTGPRAPSRVYFVKPGSCTVTAGGNYREERVSQSFTVVAGSRERIAFTTIAPTPAVVGDTYTPRVRSSEGLEVTFSIATPSVCTIMEGRRGGKHVSLIAAGTCTIDVRLKKSSRGEGPLARQSFRVRQPANRRWRPAPPALPRAKA